MKKEFIHSRYMQELQNQIASFNRENFPDQSIEGLCRHFQHEAEELAKSPADKNEQADCLILLLEICHRQGVTSAELMKNAFEKMEINRNRKWPAKPDANGVYQHIKGPEDLRQTEPAADVVNVTKVGCPRCLGRGYVASESVSGRGTSGCPICNGEGQIAATQPKP